jgi:hypothetical protein
MAYASVEDVSLILPEGGTVPPEAEDQLNVYLEEATDLVIGYLDREFIEPATGDDLVPDDVPDAVRRVVARIAMRGFTDEPGNPGAESEVELMGPFSHTINWMKEAQARSFYLTDSEKMRLDRFKLFPATGVVHVPMSGAGGTCWYA